MRLRLQNLQKFCEYYQIQPTLPSASPRNNGQAIFVTGLAASVTKPEPSTKSGGMGDHAAPLTASCHFSRARRAARRREALRGRARFLDRVLRDW